MNAAGPATRRDDLCARCLQAVPPHASRCPHCGERLTRIGNLAIVISIVGVLVLILVFLMIYLASSSQTAPNPDPDSDSSAVRRDSSRAELSAPPAGLRPG